MSNQLFDFSVVMSVYNVEPFIREAVDSLIRQTIGFDRIQLIFVDDGSPDGCGAICDEYAKEHPANVEVIHKQNGGLSSARNAGLTRVKGKYVSFLDPDDYIDKDAFKKVFRFMEAHPETDVCTIPLIMFGDEQGPHTLNGKFDGGTRVIDLSEGENWHFILLHACSSFYRAGIATQFCFDTVIYCAEDAIENQKLFIHNPRLGVVSDTVLHYRRHGDSIVAKAKRKKNWYIEYLKRYAKATLDYAESVLGYIPKYTQNAVLYDMQSKLNQSTLPKGILTEEERKEYVRLLIDCACRMDDDVILHQPWLDVTHKHYLLYRKYAGKQDTPLKVEKHIEEMPTQWDFMTFDGDSCIVEGYHALVGIDADDVEPVLLVNGQCMQCERVERNRMRIKLVGEFITEVVGFRAAIPVKALPLRIVAAVQMKARDSSACIIERKLLNFRYFFPVSDVYDNASYIDGNRMVTVDDGAIVIDRRPALVFRVIREWKWLREIWRKNLLGGRKAVAGRLYYHLVKPFKRRKLWIFMDRQDKADDNAEALYRYALKHKPRNTRLVFAINKSSPDRVRMEKLGECIGAMSLRHKLLHLVCDMEISSHLEPGDNMFKHYNDPLRDLMQHQKFVFLQHGVIKDDMSNLLNRYAAKMDGFVTAARNEYQSIFDFDYGYGPESVWLTGLPRHDRLYRDEKHVVMIMPTWRWYLFGGEDVKTGSRSPIGDFTQTDYYRFFDALINSKRLLSALDAQGYALQFFPHPVVQYVADLFHHDPRVTFLPLETMYRDAYAHSDLIITDYSSSVFDFAYLRKPIIYCQFDKEDFFGQHYDPGYFDYERDGFGEVEYTLEGTIDRIIEYVENDCRLKDKYRARIDGFFAFNDQNNCARVLEKIKQLEVKP